LAIDFLAQTWAAFLRAIGMYFLAAGPM